MPEIEHPRAAPGRGGSGESALSRLLFDTADSPGVYSLRRPEADGTAFDFGGIGCATPKGVWGYPSGANAEDGRKYIETESAQIADYIAKALSDAPNFGK